MKFLIFLYLGVIFATVSSLSVPQQSHPPERKRKKIRRKIVNKDNKKIDPITSSESPLFSTTSIPLVNDTNSEKVPRGFLDDYYSQFESRVLKPIQHAQSLITGNNKKGGSMKPYDVPIKRNDIDEELNRKLAIASLMEQDPYAMYGSTGSTGYASVDLNNSEAGDEDIMIISDKSEPIGYLPAYGYEEETRYIPSSGTGSGDALSRFFGVTGTTSQDIQLGLTFTVPFLSFPLSSLNTLLTGGAGDLFSFNTESIAIVAVLAIGAIFILPQIIYWVTGVNLSAFNWGRNDDGGDVSINSLANFVDEALSEYDVDLRSCLSKTMCTQIQERTSPDNFMTNIILSMIAKNSMVQDYMGEARMDEVLKIAKSGKECKMMYAQSTCPWDISALTKFAAKLITNNKSADFADLVSLAMQTTAAAAASSTNDL